jgi:outer membrane murein-binding lipoprotein Lpp
LKHLKNKTLSVFGILLFSAAVFMLAGCASQRDFINIKTELDALKVRNDKLEKNLGTIGNDKSQALKNQAAIQAQFSDLQTQITPGKDRGTLSCPEHGGKDQGS